MTSEIPAHDMDSLGAAPPATPSATPVRRTQPPGGSSGKHPLPSPWPQHAISQPFPDAEDVTTAPVVASANWLPEPEYWLADHQRIPRPPTRPITRPQRFRRMSRLQSALLAVIILIVVIVIGAGMVTAGRISYDFFNAPRSVPTTHPATVTPADVTPTLSAKQP